MNIFKVLASGKKSFQEETASAILTWFMDPSMEHGLGYSFISKFIDEISTSSGNSDLSDLATRLRGEDANLLKLWFNLEYNVDNAFIDIIIGINDWIIAIENKIYAKSVSEGQLTREYEGLKKKKPDAKIGMIYLVPIDENSDILDGKTENEFEELSTKDDDLKVLVTWQKNNIDNTPSISEMIGKILKEENKGIIDPVSEYTRHTLKALISFISDSFTGYYDDERDNQSSSINPLTEERLQIDDLRLKNSGYVGVKGAISGLLNMDKTALKTHKFKYTSQDMSLKRRAWLEIDTFNKIVSWILYNKIEDDIKWEGRLSSKNLSLITKDYKSKVYIGIRGGENALKSMDKDEIISRAWQISTHKKSSEWIDGELFCNVELFGEQNPFEQSGIIDLCGNPISSTDEKFVQVTNDISYINSCVFESILKRPDFMYEVSPREFEEFVAELFHRKGYEVNLTPASNDGGVDIYASCHNDIGSLLYLLQCKRNRPKNKVGVSVVRDLYGVVSKDNATAGLVVTSSFYTKGAKDFQSKVKHQMNLWDYTNLLRKLDSFRTKGRFW